MNRNAMLLEHPQYAHMRGPSSASTRENESHPRSGLRRRSRAREQKDCQ